MIELRRSTPDDVAAVGRLVECLFAELNDGQAGPAYQTSSVERVLQDTERSFGYLAFDDQDPVGILLMTDGVAIFAGGAFGQITELYVTPEFRSKGIAAMLMHQAADFGRSRGWRRLDVGAPHQPRWHRTLGFYLSEGFVEVGPRLRLDL
ncbi:GNAT family N-acetyltransferase [Paraburkholderia sediminicola]|uniref:GNAT family N-acetyltransferase n=1 Tax=Paraburkholderia sediminicola TaxID=458836 RepID=UPI0038B79206